MSTVKLAGRNIVIQTSAGARIDITQAEANELINQLIDLLDEAQRTLE